MTDSLISSEAVSQTTVDETINETTEETSTDTGLTEGVDPVEPETNEDSPAQPEKLLAGKYKTPEDLEQGYKELSKKLREKTEPPEKYDLDSLKNNEELAGLLPEDYSFQDDPMFQVLEPAFREAGLTQDQVVKLTQAKMLFDKANMVDPKAEMEKLGSNAGQVITDVRSFVDSSLPDDLKEVAEAFAYTAEGVKLLHHMSQLQKTAMPTKTAEQKVSPDELINTKMARVKELKSAKGFDLNRSAKAEVEKLQDEIATIQLRKEGKL